MPTPKCLCVSFQATTSNQRAQLDEAAMRDCMAAKGYKVDIAPR
jgi:hypothetical protein